MTTRETSPFELAIRIAADLTLKRDLKERLIARLEKPFTEEEYAGFTHALDVYWEKTTPLLRDALARMRPEELARIQSAYVQMEQNGYRIVEKHVEKKERKIAQESLITMI